MRHAYVWRGWAEAQTELCVCVCVSYWFYLEMVNHWIKTMLALEKMDQRQ